jgi:carbon monoxide dehydrogenase subunit G
MAELTLSVEVDASPEEVWAAAVDWDRQHEWMTGTTVRGGHGLGATLVGETRWRGLGFTDPMTVTTWDPPLRCVVRHDGRVVRGSAAFEVLPGERTRFVWTEWLVLPGGLLGELGFLLVKPLVTIPLRQSLDRFAQRVSSRGTSAAPWRGTT